MDAEQETLVQGVYSGVFPVKCNHDRELLECILEAGRPFNYGLEVGSRAELLMAMSMIGRSPGALLICNGYKDAAFMRLVQSPVSVLMMRLYNASEFERRTGYQAFLGTLGSHSLPLR